MAPGGGLAVRFLCITERDFKNDCVLLAKNAFPFRRELVLALRVFDFAD